MAKKYRGIDYLEKTLSERGIQTYSLGGSHSFYVHCNGHNKARLIKKIKMCGIEATLEREDLVITPRDGTGLEIVREYVRRHLNNGFRIYR